MEEIRIDAAGARLSLLLERVRHGAVVTITRRGEPVARLVPVAHDRARAREAVARIVERRRHIEGASMAESMAAVHEGHRY